MVAGPLLVARGCGTWPIMALAVYAVSVSGLFGISALYHRGTWGPNLSVTLITARIAG
jgi:hemolysin III